jgi:hypothetical protein
VGPPVPRPGRWCAPIRPRLLAAFIPRSAFLPVPPHLKKRKRKSPIPSRIQSPNPPPDPLDRGDPSSIRSRTLGSSGFLVYRIPVPILGRLFFFLGFCGWLGQNPRGLALFKVGDSFSAGGGVATRFECVGSGGGGGEHGRVRDGGQPRVHPPEHPGAHGGPGREQPLRRGQPERALRQPRQLRPGTYQPLLMDT